MLETYQCDGYGEQIAFHVPVLSVFLISLFKIISGIVIFFIFLAMKMT